jgi:hypothetical protein
MWLTLSDVVLSSVSELDSLVLTSGSTGWDSGSVETLGGGDLDLDGRVTCSSQQVYSTHQSKGREGGGMSGAGLHFLPTRHADSSQPHLSKIIGKRCWRWVGRVGEATYLESRRSKRHQQLFPNSFPSTIPRTRNSPRHTHQLTCRACTLVTVDIVIVLV